MPDILSHIDALPKKDYAQGDCLLTEGEPGGTLFVLIDGAVSVTKGGVEVARVAETGAVFGEMSILLNLPVSATITANGPVRVAVIDDPATYLAETPALALHTAKILASRLHAATTYLADIKRQYQDRDDHLSMVDRVLDAMVEQQPRGVRIADRDNDPRL